jgi:hypothetical protein
MTLQEEINILRVILGETDPLNSRWQDATHLKYYANFGRREFAKCSKALISEFRRTTTVGATALGSNEEARYDLDPTMIEIDSMSWDGHPVYPAARKWDEITGRVEYGRGDEITQDIPRHYRRVGNSIDLNPAPPEQKILSILASVFTTNIVNLTDPDLELNDDQIEGAMRLAAAKALTDDGRDGSAYLAEGLRICNDWKRISTPSGSKGVLMSSGGD